MIDRGIFRPDDRLELIDGQLVVKEPQDSDHFTAILLVADALRAAFGPGWLVRPQGPVALDDRSEPEPDVSVARGTPRDYREGHPIRPVLVVEVSKTRLGFDRARKATLYARNGLEDYWIVNVLDRVLEVYREPSRGGRTGYGSVRTLGPDESVTPLAAPAACILVADLLP